MLVTLNDVLKRATKEHYAVGLFNTIDTVQLEAAISAAEELRSPIIIGTAEILLPHGELDLIAPSIVAAAKRASVPVVVHFDHGLTFERCMQALDLGFSSVMFDGSTSPYEENVAKTREIVRIAHKAKASVEGEIGHVGEAADGENEQYTTVTDAVRFLNDTGVDALAVAIGTAHGVYKSKPNLNLQRLQEIKSAVDVPLVLHGGSGLSDDDFRNAIKCGIGKINIFTDLLLAGEAAQREGAEQHLGYMETRDLTVKAVKETVMHKIRLFGSVGKA